jgi:hypothetical protein
MYDGAVDPERKNNLWSPVEGDHGARGAFSDRSRDGSPQLWANTHLGTVAGVALTALGAVAAAYAWLRARA